MVTPRLSAHLVKRLKGFELDVAFDLGPGISVIFGPSGAGKTLTLKMLAGLLAPDAGRVALDGRVFFDAADRRGTVPPQGRRLGVVFQGHSLFPHLTVRQNIEFGAPGQDPARRGARVAELVQLFRLGGLEERRPSQISGGQQQRVALARAIVGRPHALLLDEPFSALDHPTRVAMRLCLSDVMRHLDIPVVLVTHDLHEACSMADTMLVFVDGRLVQRGTPREVVLNPIDDVVAELVHRDHPLPTSDAC